MKKILTLILLMSCLIMASCGKKEISQQSSPKKTDDKIEIGMSFDSFVIERWQRDRDVFVSTAKELGATVNVQNANGEIDKQKEQIEYFVKKGVDVIVIICIDSEALKDSVQKAKDAGIKIIAYDRLVSNANADLYITFDNAEVGRLMAEELSKQYPKVNNVLMIGGSPLDGNVALVDTGFKLVCENKGINILDVTHCDGWRAELAGEYIYNNTDLVKQADAIMCGNDNLASSVVRALAENRLAGNIYVTGQDADLDACQRIVENTQLMTVYKPVEKLASRAAECAILLAKGESIEGDDVSSINDGTYNIPYIGLTPVAVNADNMNEVIINSGFHLKEDVYLNVVDN